MKTVIEMAREAGFKASVGKTDKDGKYHPDVNALSRDVPIEWLERFAELVRADEREKYKWDVHSCGPTCTKVACVAMREAIEAEREACAKVCENRHWTIDSGNHFAAAIRARAAHE